MSTATASPTARAPAQPAPAAARPHAPPAAIRAWADLLTRQLAALETGDIEAFLELGPTSDEAAACARDDAADPAALQACASLLDAVQARLRTLRDATRAELHNLEDRTPAVRHYAPAPASRRLDVRF